MTKTAFIFGAGASYGATAEGGALPLQAGLLNCFVSAQSKVPAVIASRRIVLQYLKAMYPGPRTGMKMPLEEVIGPLEWLEARESSFHIGDPEMRNVRTLAAFDTLLACALNRPILRNRRVPVPKEGGPDVYTRMYDNFYACRPDSPNAYAVLLWKLLSSRVQFLLVSLNYDLILDRTLFHKSSGTNVNYHIPFVSGDEYLYKGTGTSLIKPHGSLNWSWCTVCKRLMVSGAKTIFRGGNCLDCSKLPTGECLDPYSNWPHGSLQPLLLRPSFMKILDIAESVWNGVLETGGNLLSGCENWVFIGYSFPSADYWFRAWLRLSAHREQIKVPKRVILVDPDSVGAYSRYHAFFGDDFVYRNQTFWEFAHNWDPTLPI